MKSPALLGLSMLLMVTIAFPIAFPDSAGTIIGGWSTEGVWPEKVAALKASRDDAALIQLVDGSSDTSWCETLSLNIDGRLYFKFRAPTYYFIKVTGIQITNGKPIKGYDEISGGMIDLFYPDSELLYSHSLQLNGTKEAPIKLPDSTIPSGIIVLKYYGPKASLRPICFAEIRFDAEYQPVWWYRPIVFLNRLAFVKVTDPMVSRRSFRDGRSSRTSDYYKYLMNVVGSRADFPVQFLKTPLNSGGTDEQVQIQATERRKPYPSAASDQVPPKGITTSTSEVKLRNEGSAPIDYNSVVTFPIKQLMTGSALVSEDDRLKCSLVVTVTDGKYGLPSMFEVRIRKDDEWVSIIEDSAAWTSSTQRRGDLPCADLAGVIVASLDFKQTLPIDPLLKKFQVDPEEIKKHPDDEPLTLKRLEIVRFEVADSRGRSTILSVMKITEPGKNGNVYDFALQSSRISAKGVWEYGQNDADSNFGVSKNDNQRQPDPATEVNQEPESLKNSSILVSNSRRVNYNIFPKKVEIRIADERKPFGETAWVTANGQSISSSRSLSNWVDITKLLHDGENTLWVSATPDNDGRIQVSISLKVDGQVILEQSLQREYAQERYGAAYSLLLPGEVDVGGFWGPSLEDALCTSLIDGDLGKAKRALDKGANPNAHCGIGGLLAPLVMSARWGDVELVRFLLQKGADVNPKGQTPLGTAIRRLDTEIIRSLIKAGADVNVEMANGKSLLDIARDSANTDAEALLRQAGAQ